MDTFQALWGRKIAKQTNQTSETSCLIGFWQSYSVFLSHRFLAHMQSACTYVVFMATYYSTPSHHVHDISIGATERRSLLYNYVCAVLILNSENAQCLSYG